MSVVRFLVIGTSYVLLNGFNYRSLFDIDSSLSKPSFSSVSTVALSYFETIGLCFLLSAGTSFDSTNFSIGVVD